MLTIGKPPRKKHFLGATYDLNQENFQHLILQLDQAQTRIEELRAEKYVPGRWRCYICETSSVENTLFIETATVCSTEVRECLKGCGPMERVTWKQLAFHYRETLMTWQTKEEEGER